MPWDRRDTLWTLAAAGAALVLRTIAAVQSAVVGADAHAYTLGALEISGGAWAPSLARGVHPGYPVAIAAFARAMDLETAGYAVSVLAASLSVAVFYAFVRDLGGPGVARVASLIYAVLPRVVLGQADILTEGLFHLLFLSAVALAWWGLTRGRVGPTLGAGAVGALAYFTRPEGLYAPILILGLAALVRARGRVLASAAAAVAIFLILAFPLLLAFRDVAGGWTVSPRESVRRIAEGGGAAAGWARAVAEAAGGLATVTQWAAPLALLGLWWGRPRAPGRAFLACLFAGYLWAPLAARAGGHGLSSRHLLLPAVFLLPLIAAGGCAAADRFARFVPPRRASLAAAVVLVLFLMAAVPRASRPRRRDERPIKAAALWLRETAPAEGLITSNTYKAAHYLRRRVRQLRDAPEAVDAVRLERGDRLFVVEDALEEGAPGGLSRLEARFERVARFPAEGAGGLRVSIFVQRSDSAPR